MSDLTIQGLIHVIPINDLREHIEDTSCWCRPTPADDNAAVIIHHSMDRREEYEQGRKYS